MANHPLIMMEGAIIERLRRSYGIELHPTLANAPLIYDPKGRRALEELYQGYIDIARRAGLPILICTPTWRASRSRVTASQLDRNINIDAAAFMRELCDADLNQGAVIKIGGMVGCKNDAYQPNQGLPVTQAQHFHAWQIQQLVKGGVDFLIAETLPNVKEALGIAKAMENTATPYMISFVISRDGCVLDGTPLADAIALIDDHTIHSPLGYMVNCAHPVFLCPQRQPATLFKRLLGYLANASCLDHAELDRAPNLMADDLSQWGDLMIALHQHYGVQILGGCCGTGGDHLQYIVDGIAKQPST